MEQSKAADKLAERIAATKAAYEALKEAASADLSGLRHRMGRKLAKNRFRKKLPGEVARVVAFVAAHFGLKSADVTECAAEGRSIFTTAPDDALDDHLEALLSAVKAREAVIGPDPVARATALVTDWAKIYAASEASSAQKSLAEQRKRGARKVLQGELYLNLAELMRLFPEDEEAVRRFMQESLLRPR